ncbi:unnamed protein product [Penicillium crustosum]
MWNRDSLDRDTELIPIPHHRSADLLIQSTSERESERYSERDTERLAVYNEEFKPKHGWLFQGGDQFQGWRFTICLAFIASLIVFLFNLGFMLYTISHHRQDDTEGTLYQGDCDKVQHLDIGFHLLINILSTTLLSASNFGMVVDKYPQINISNASLHRQDEISTELTEKGNGSTSECPVSATFSVYLKDDRSYGYAWHPPLSLSTSSYNIFLGHGDLGKIYSPDLEVPLHDTDKWSSFNGLLSSAKNGSLQHLDPKECVENYAQTFQTTYGDLLLVTEQVSTNTSYVYLTTQGVLNPRRYLDLTPPQADPYRWLCPSDWSDDCEVYLPTIQSQIKKDDWSVGGTSSSGGGWKIDYCLAKKARQFCKLQYSFPLTMVVITFNLVKSTILCYMWFGMKEAPILTIGDAIASFLRRPDPYTKGGCLLLNREAESMSRSSSASIKKYPLHEARKGLMAIFACIALLIYGISQIKTGSTVWKATLGEVNPSTLIIGDHWPGTLIPIVIIANMPQLMFSFLYFAFNSLLTAMNIGAEWSGYAVNRKGLRVSGSPSFSQRSNYFLSLPYRYAIPLMVVSALLHWLISRSLFIVGIDAYSPSMERQQDNDILTCGYSPVAIVSSIAVGSFMFFCVVGLSFRLFESGMPVVGSCSFTISAACHPAFDPNREGNGEIDQGMECENEDEDMALLPVQWGSVPVVGSVGHCSFTSGDVEEPHGEQKYL